MLLSDYGIIQKINPAFTGCLQYSAGEVEGKGYAAMVHPDDKGKVTRFIEAVKEKRAISNVVHQLIRKDNSYVQINWSGTYQPEQSLILCIGRKVTDMEVNYREHLKKEHLFQLLIDNSYDFLAHIDENGKWLYVSESVSTILGYNRESLIGQYCFDYMHPDDLPYIQEQFQYLLNGQKKIQGPPYRFKNAAGDWIWMEAIVNSQLDNPGIGGVVISGRDINDRIAAERNAKEMQLLEALREGEEKERSRLARDLHDEISGMVAAAKMHFAALSFTIPQIGEIQEFRQGNHLLDETALKIRNTSHNLMPEILLDNGLDQALNQYCRNISNAQLKIEYLVIGQVVRYPANFELSLYRIVQELINNIIRHAKATQALVQISYQNNSLCLTIEDNGIGFNEVVQSEGTGLQSIQRRIAIMNGTMEIQSTAGQGASIYLEFQP